AHIYGGPTMSVAMLCEQLNIAGVNASVFTTTANGENELPVITGQRVNVEGVEVTYFKRITKDHTHFSPQLLKNLWSEVSNFDAIHIHAWWNLVSVLSCLIAVLKNVPVILSPRGTLSTYSFNNKNAGAKKLIHRSLGKYLLKRITVHATSVHEKEILTGIVPAENISILPNFVRLPVKEYPVKKEWSGVLKLLFLSRIEPKKGLDLLIDALKDIQVPWHLTIAGSGNNDYVDQLKTMAQPYINNKQVIWLGFQDESKFNLFYNNDLMILPSHDENFGNVVIESLSVGTCAGK
ncbi:MAG: glycosyltransferase, partial [Sphingobacteriaceae bacterium]